MRLVGFCVVFVVFASEIAQRSLCDYCETTSSLLLLLSEEVYVLFHHLV